MIVDPFGKYDNNAVFHIHPDQLMWLDKLASNSFLVCKVYNTSCSELTPRVFSGLHKIIKENGCVDILVHQKLSVLQELDAQEIEFNAKLAGFVCVETSDFERFENVDGKDVRFRSLIVTMLRH